MRRLPLLALLLLLPALLAAPHAAAQVPTPPCGPIQLEAPTTPANPLAPGARGEVAVMVSNQGQRAVEVKVQHDVAGGGEGWTVTPPADTATIASGQSATFTYVVQPTDAAAADLTLTFAVVSAVCGIAPGSPVCPPEACEAALPQQQSALVRRQDDQGLGLGLGDFDLSLEYLVAGIVLVGVATAIPFLLRKKGGGFTAECPEPLKMVRPGRGTSFPIEIRNAGNEPLTAQFEIGPVPEGWTAFMPLPEVQLAARESRSLWLMVRSPASAQEGEAAEVEVRLRNPARPNVAPLVRVRAEINPAATDAAPRA